MLKPIMTLDEMTQHFIENGYDIWEENELEEKYISDAQVYHIALDYIGYRLECDDDSGLIIFIYDNTFEQKCNRCGKSFYLQYKIDGTYECLEKICDCESGFSPADGMPSIEQWLIYNKKVDDKDMEDEEDEEDKEDEEEEEEEEEEEDYDAIIERYGLPDTNQVRQMLAYGYTPEQII